jgi:hypothetical protein
MKKIIFTILMLSFTSTLFAQRLRGQDIEAQKVAFITTKLNLSPEEAKVFWPIYNEMHAEQNAFRKERIKKMISFKKTAEIDNLSDTEVQNLITSEQDFKQRELNLEKKYYNKLKAVLPIKIIGKFYRAQEAFKKELLNQYKNGQR